MLPILTIAFGVTGCSPHLPEPESNDIKPIINGAQLCAQGLLTARHGKQYIVTQDEYKTTLNICNSAIRALQPKAPNPSQSSQPRPYMASTRRGRKCRHLWGRNNFPSRQ